MTTITRKDLIKPYLDFFTKHKHKQIPSSPLIPENDPTSLFNTAGMQPLVPFLQGKKHPLGNRIVNVQKCIRTNDIDEVGDTYHHTFFEMLGNWSLGDYWKQEAIKLTFQFHTQILKIPLEKYAVTCFGADPDFPNLPIDEESKQIWLSLGVPEERIAFLPGGVKTSDDNWWGPAGETGPCGPSTEMFYWSSQEPAPKTFDPKDERWIEIGNDVLMEYNKTKSGSFEPLAQKNIDFGGGVERTLATLNGIEDNYDLDLFKPIIQEIEKLSKKKYKFEKGDLGFNEMPECWEKDMRSMRIIADHTKAAIMILGDPRGVSPSNIGQGYVLRRLIRRAIRHASSLGISEAFLSKLLKPIQEIYPDYKELKLNEKFILQNLQAEEEKFSKTLEKGLKKFNELAQDSLISGKEAFLLFQSFGFPIEMTQELANEKGIKVDLEEYNKESQAHQDLSRTASAGAFKSGLADDSEATRKLHTATHLLNEILRVVLGPEVKQKGSNINPERLRFDFSFDRKLTPEEKTQVEDLVNKKIKESLKISSCEVPLQQALDSGAQAEFGNKYPELVSVYTIEDPSDPKGWFSKEICTGPHVENTSELGTFKIKKEESSSAGVRRIKAILN